MKNEKYRKGIQIIFVNVPISTLTFKTHYNVHLLSLSLIYEIDNDHVVLCLDLIGFKIIKFN